jgi:hypothetical protein
MPEGLHGLDAADVHAERLEEQVRLRLPREYQTP